MFRLIKNFCWICRIQSLFSFLIIFICASFFLTELVSPTIVFFFQKNKISAFLTLSTVYVFSFINFYPYAYKLFLSLSSFICCFLHLQNLILYVFNVQPFFFIIISISCYTFYTLLLICCWRVLSIIVRYILKFLTVMGVSHYCFINACSMSI